MTIPADSIANPGPRFRRKTGVERLTGGPRVGTALSPREQEVVDLYVAGVTCKEISARLGLNMKTASTYLRRACDRLGVKNNQLLIAHVVRMESVKP